MPVTKYQPRNALVGFVLIFAVVSAAFSATSVAKDPSIQPKAPQDELPVGRWRVEFSNRVVEISEIAQDGSASVTEPLRSSIGKAVQRDRAAIIVFEDDRVERWTTVGHKQVVQHWASSSQWPRVSPVLGIAERIE